MTRTWTWIASAALVIFPMAVHSEILQEYPQLKRFVGGEPKLELKFGGGISPFQIVKDRVGFSLSLFQLHFRWDRWFDWEVFNASFGMTLGGDKTSKLQNFSFRTAPKFRMNSMFSVGPLVGYELISFPDVKAVQSKNNLSTKLEPFSSRGFVYGALVSETFKLSENFTLRTNQVFYKQNYPTGEIQDGWRYVFTDAAVNNDRSKISAGYVFLLEFALLY